MPSKHKQRGWIGAAIGAVAGLVGANKANSDARENSAMAVDQQRYLRQTAYQDTVSSLKSAGLNPMLAYQNGTQTPSVGQAPVKNVGESMTNSAASLAQLQNIEAQNELLRAQAAKTAAETEAIPTSTANVAQQTENLKAAIPKIVAEVKNISMQTLTEEERVALTRQQNRLVQIDQDFRKGQITNIEAQTRTQNALTTLRRLEIPGAKNIAQWEESLGQYSKEAGAAGTAAKTLGGVVNSARKVLGK